MVLAAPRKTLFEASNVPKYTWNVPPTIPSPLVENSTTSCSPKKESEWLLAASLSRKHSILNARILGSLKFASLDHETFKVCLSITLTDTVDGGNGNPRGVSLDGSVSMDFPVPISPFIDDTRT